MGSVSFFEPTASTYAAGLIEQTLNSLVLSITNAKANALEELDQGYDFEYITTGHSLGGALSVLGAGVLATRADVFGGGAPLPNQVKCVAFSPPNVGDEDCVHHIHGLLGQHNILCYANKLDVVTHVPPTLFGYYTSAGTRIEYEVFDHFMETSSDVLTGLGDIRPQEAIEAGLGLSMVRTIARCAKKTVVVCVGTSVFFMHKAPALDHVRKKHLECMSVARRLENIEDFPRYVPKHPHSDLSSWLGSFF